MLTVEFNDINHSGLTAQITFNPWTGGSSSLGSHTIPYVYSSQYPYGTYNFNYSPWNQDCSILVPPPCDLTSYIPRLNYKFCSTHTTGETQIISGASTILISESNPTNVEGGFDINNNYPITFRSIYNDESVSTNLMRFYVLNNTTNTYLYNSTGTTFNNFSYAFTPQNNYIYSLYYYLMPSQPGEIDVVNLQVCPNRIYQYAIGYLPTDSTYVVWTIPSNGTIISGQGTRIILVSYTSSIVSGFVTVQSFNSCGENPTIISQIVKLGACPIP